MAPCGEECTERALPTARNNIIFWHSRLIAVGYAKPDCHTCSAVLRIVLLNNNCANQLCMNTLYRQTMVVSYIHFVKVQVVVCGLGVSIFQKLSSG